MIESFLICNPMVVMRALAGSTGIKLAAGCCGAGRCYGGVELLGRALLQSECGRGYLLMKKEFPQTIIPTDKSDDRLLQLVSRHVSD